ncbi:FAD-dependent monooxygenase [Halorubrum sp. Ib24]|uniref:FAD-dependent oxidoreductase n=1 Tax=Halorubrum sp. Ib24 TaxID=1383850 RepID=UPI000B98FCA9|nr:FAD-dependent monooxygenase [Halorubrum sp. Ib24]OYR40555.1 FAD-dependent monooxygenase [Halorubrum sp. Ib24]
MNAGEERSTRAPPVVSRQYDNGVSGTHRDREKEILIADTGFSALVTAGLLDRAGFDPLLAPSPSDRSPPRVTVIWEPGLRVLDQLGLRQSVERCGTPVTELDRTSSEKSWEADGSTEIALVAIKRDQLRALLEQAVRGRVRETNRAVTALESAASGVQATFDHEGTESFDVAVTADQSLSADQTAEPDGRVHTWECHQFETTSRATESWGPSAATFSTPTGDSTSLRFVTTAETPARAAVSADAIADRFSHLNSPPADLRRVLKNGGFEYRRVRLAAPTSVSTGQIGLIGPAARTALPGTHLGPSTDIETSWSLAAAITDASGTMTEALSSYEQRRRKLSARFRTWLDDVQAPDLSLSPELRLLFFARQLAFSHVTGAAHSFKHGIAADR